MPAPPFIDQFEEQIFPESGTGWTTPHGRVPTIPQDSSYYPSSRTVHLSQNQRNAQNQQNQRNERIDQRSSTGTKYRHRWTINYECIIAWKLISLFIIFQGNNKKHYCSFRVFSNETILVLMRDFWWIDGRWRRWWWGRGGKRARVGRRCFYRGIPVDKQNVTIKPREIKIEWEGRGNKSLQVPEQHTKRPQ